MTLTNSSGTVHVTTTRFGALDVEEDLIIHLPYGMIGFEDCKRFVVLHHDERSAFRWLQCLDDGAVAFPIIEPNRFKPDYHPTISEGDLRELALGGSEERLVFVVVTVPRDRPEAMTANLLGPIVINPLSRCGKQVIVMDEGYTTKHPVMEEIRAMARK